MFRFDVLFDDNAHEIHESTQLLCFYRTRRNTTGGSALTSKVCHPPLERGRPSRTCCEDAWTCPFQAWPTSANMHETEDKTHKSAEELHRNNERTCLVGAPRQTFDHRKACRARLPRKLLSLHLPSIFSEGSSQLPLRRRLFGTSLSGRSLTSLSASRVCSPSSWPAMDLDDATEKSASALKHTMTSRFLRAIILSCYLILIYILLRWG